jgi:diguanylate cyclase (GGDEF)-like protein
MQANLLHVALLALATIATLTGIILYFFSRLTSQLSTLRQQLKAQAVTDPLTGLFNRRYLMERFEYELVRGQRSGETMGCIMLDIDHFKDVNDRCGHLVGDTVLKTLARCLREAVRPYDIVGRYGGEEFLVIAPHTTLDELAAIAERLRADIVLLPLPEEMTRMGMTLSVSAGITGQRQEDSADRIIHRADTALYRAKEAGRNRVEALP